MEESLLVLPWLGVPYLQGVVLGCRDVGQGGPTGVHSQEQLLILVRFHTRFCF